MNFAPNKGRAGELLALLDAAIAGGARHHPRHLPVPARCHHALGGAAELVVGRRPGRHARPAARSRGARPRSATTSRSPAPTAATAWSPSGTPSRSAGSPAPSSTAWSGARSRGSPPTREPRPVRRLRRRAASATSWAPGSCSTSGTRRTCRRSCATRGTRAAATACWSAPSRTRARGARSRATSATTAATWASSRWRSASGTSPGGAAARLGLRDRGLVRDGYAADLVLFDPDTVADTATYAQPAASRGGHPVRAGQRRVRAWTTASAPMRSPAARCGGGPDGIVA